MLSRPGTVLPMLPCVAGAAKACHTTSDGLTYLEINKRSGVLRLAQVLRVCYTSVAKEVACHLRRTRRRTGSIKLLAACSCSAPLSLGSPALFPTPGAGTTAADWRQSNRLLISTPWQ